MAKVERRVPLFIVLFHLVLGARYQLGHCLSCASCNIYSSIIFYYFSLSNVFYIFFKMYILIDNMQRIQ